MGIIMLVFFFYFKRFEFFFYSIYVLFLLTYIGNGELIAFGPFRDSFVGSWNVDNIPIFTGLAYMLFTNFYLNLKKDYPIALKIVKISILIHLLILVIDFIFLFFKYDYGHIGLVQIFPIISSLSGFLLIGYLLAYNKNRITTIFIIGSVVLMISISAFYFLREDSDPLLYNNKIYVIVGGTIEIILFAFGLIYKIFSEHIERLKFQKEAFTNKNKALRAQINPHFIFNSLNSIQHLVIKDDKVSALKYLTKFGKLIRNILESSFEVHAKLEAEIKLLKDYLELESLRFDNAFSYEIKVDKTLDTESIKIPFMLLQPFVENGIIHGLLPKSGNDRKLTIRFKDENDTLICEIEDNGVGRPQVNPILDEQKTRKSRGLEVTKQRIRSMWENSEGLQIIDKIDNENNPLGTKVIVRIPVY